MNASRTKASSHDALAGSSDSLRSPVLSSNMDATSSPHLCDGLAWPACTQDAETADTKHAPIPAPVAQRKEQQHPTLQVAGSNPAGRSIRFYDGFVEPKTEIWRR